MSLIVRHPFGLVKQLHNDVNQLFDNHLSVFDNYDLGKPLADINPRIDIKEDAEGYTLMVETPGIKPEDVHVTIKDGVLSIKGEHKQEEEKKEENYLRRERVFGSFSRQFSVPQGVTDENISAKVNHGVLEVRIQKTSETESRRINVE